MMVISCDVCHNIGHRNIYVGVHVPYSRSKHKHRSRRKQNNGQSKHGRSHRRSSDASSNLEEANLDTEMESMSLGGIEEARSSSFHGSQSDGGVRRPYYHKSMSAPSSRPRTPPPELAIPPTIIGELLVHYCSTVLLHVTMHVNTTLSDL